MKVHPSLEELLPSSLQLRMRSIDDGEVELFELDAAVQLIHVGEDSFGLCNVRESTPLLFVTLNTGFDVRLSVCGNKPELLLLAKSLNFSTTCSTTPPMHRPSIACADSLDSKSESKATASSRSTTAQSTAGEVAFSMRPGVGSRSDHGARRRRLVSIESSAISEHARASDFPSDFPSANSIGSSDLLDSVSEGWSHVSTKSHKALDESQHDFRSFDRFRIPWQPDSDAPVCNFPSCGTRFFFARRHHCRMCGMVFCDNHSRSMIQIRCLGYFKPVRVCEVCTRNVAELRKDSRFIHHDDQLLYALLLQRLWLEHDREVAKELAGITKCADPSRPSTQDELRECSVGAAWNLDAAQSVVSRAGSEGQSEAAHSSAVDRVEDAAPTEPIAVPNRLSLQISHSGVSGRAGVLSYHAGPKKSKRRKKRAGNKRVQLKIQHLPEQSMLHQWQTDGNTLVQQSKVYACTPRRFSYPPAKDVKATRISLFLRQLANTDASRRPECSGSTKLPAAANSPHPSRSRPQLRFRDKLTSEKVNQPKMSAAFRLQIPDQAMGIRVPRRTPLHTAASSRKPTTPSYCSANDGSFSAKSSDAQATPSPKRRQSLSTLKVSSSASRSWLHRRHSSHSLFARGSLRMPVLANAKGSPSASPSKRTASEGTGSNEGSLWTEDQVSSYGDSEPLFVFGEMEAYPSSPQPDSRTTVIQRRPGRHHAAVCLSPVGACRMNVRRRTSTLSHMSAAHTATVGEGDCIAASRGSSPLRHEFGTCSEPFGFDPS